ncbi:preprotein translocase subunit SecE [Fundidesulfovibrio terrae]|uniref:preprotein translocase subunit SecE n=1 Tax=Fundidesulfovibrio terrae TaxID=2922866 RepID=UPI001FAE7592|nr:preprotein translocase subunit SecE [Fundidesulfovibrio terrae]
MATKKGKSGEAAEIEVSAASSVKGKVEELKEFFELSKVEIKKVTWPTRKETMVTSVAVVVLVVVMTIFLGVVDLGLSKLIEFVLS